jgi:hypothetical protein
MINCCRATHRHHLLATTPQLLSTSSRPRPADHNARSDWELGEGRGCWRGRTIALSVTCGC